jgi:hypothetical protein
MSVSVTMWLFGAVRRGMEPQSTSASKRLLQLQKAMGEYLQEISEMVKILEQNGWEVAMGVYDLSLSHPDVRTRADAEEKLHELGIDPKLFNLDEYSL